MYFKSLSLSLSVSLPPPKGSILRAYKRLIRDSKSTLTSETRNKVEGGNFRFCPKRVNAKISSINKQTRVKTNKKSKQISKNSPYCISREKREKRLTPEPNFRFCPKQGSLLELRTGSHRLSASECLTAIAN